MNTSQKKFRVFYDNRWFYFVMGQSMTHYEHEIYSQCNFLGLEYLQFTGLHDKNGVEIYEKSNVKIYHRGDWIIRQIVFTDGMFCLQWSDGYISKYPLNPSTLEVIDINY